MCKSTGFTGTIKGGFNTRACEFKIIDVVTDSADGWLLEFGGGSSAGYETIELSQDAMDEGRCVLLGDCDVLSTTDETDPYFEGGSNYTYRHGDTDVPVTYSIPAEAELDAQEQLTDTLLDDAIDGPYDAEQEVTVLGRLRPMWAMKHAGQTIGW